LLLARDGAGSSVAAARRVAGASCARHCAGSRSPGRGGFGRWARTVSGPGRGTLGAVLRGVGAALSRVWAPACSAVAPGARLRDLWLQLGRGGERERPGGAHAAGKKGISPGGGASKGAGARRLGVNGG
jgi:hypothetical protein